MQRQNKYAPIIGILAAWLVWKVSGLYIQEPPYTEEERIAEYHRRGYTWPLREGEYVPNVKGWKELMKRRFEQVIANTEPQERWDGWLQTIASAKTVPNFTEFGWGLTHGPEQLTLELVDAVYKGIPTARGEGQLDILDGPMPLFIDREDLMHKVLFEMKPILEAWAGIELEPSIAYGFRLYRNESRLWMHVDRTQTHVISCIYHIASSKDADPWPIVVEDFDGHTNSVVLKPGDILLYESAKTFHGRPSRFKGTFYTSVLVHFYPKEGWNSIDRDLECHYAVPPKWYETQPSSLEKLRWVGASALEPECPDSWCNLRCAKTWKGPWEYGKILTGRGRKFDLQLLPRDVLASRRNQVQSRVQCCLSNRSPAPSLWQTKCTAEVV
ncbi:unnamed protein product [Cylindrotheca closterium]|uniref:Prolyl 4-hydroxylase alpha subunit Fe(2+) 2OG dioxygenase domain-containing protein n=1 Tax=Cylindrotheca closterium TaxID=2856 RepID=A0AAD2JJU0_9STRA|nr:unnamed protein product [Cylindrotheca closterium]